MSIVSEMSKDRKHEKRGRPIGSSSDGGAVSAADPTDDEEDPGHLTKKLRKISGERLQSLSKRKCVGVFVPRSGWNACVQNQPYPRRKQIEEDGEVGVVVPRSWLPAVLPDPCSELFETREFRVKDTHQLFNSRDSLRAGQGDSVLAAATRTVTVNKNSLKTKKGGMSLQSEAQTSSSARPAIMQGVFGRGSSLLRFADDSDVDAEAAESDTGEGDGPSPERAGAGKRAANNSGEGDEAPLNKRKVATGSSVLDRDGEQTAKRGGKVAKSLSGKPKKIGKMAVFSARKVVTEVQQLLAQVSEVVFTVGRLRFIFGKHVEN